MIKKISFILLVFFIISLFFVAKFGYYNINYTNMPTYQEHQIYLTKHKYETKSYKYYPVPGKEGKGITCGKQEKCYIFYATIEEKELSPSESNTYSFVHRNRDVMKVKGMSIPMYKLINMNYVKLVGDGKISFFEPKL